MAKLPRPSFRRRRGTPADPAAEPAAETTTRPQANQEAGAAKPSDSTPATSSASPEPDATGQASTTPIPPIGDLSPSEPAAGGRRLPSPTPPSLWPDWSRRLLAVLAVLVIAGGAFAAGYLINDDSDDVTALSPAPPVIVESAPQPESAERIGFPEFATRNTTRVGGGDPIADGAGVALASYPALGGVGGPQAVIVAPADDWQAALAAAPLSADPIAAPVLLSEQDEVPALTREALAALGPQGIEDAEGVQLIQVGDVAVPPDFETLTVGERGDDAAEIAKQVDAERARLSGEKDPDHILVVSSESPELAMPAAAWAARSGDPILFAAEDEVPEPTLEAIAKHKNAPVFVLAPESAISPKAIKELEKDAASVTRISNETDPVESAIEFARFVDGDFGWNINDPGHGFVIVNAERPLDAAVAAPLSAGGKPGPLLVTTDAQTVPAALQAFLSDTQPGFVDDPARAVYNHVWLLGDTETISVAFQSQVDELIKLIPVSGGTAGPRFGPAPGVPDDEEPPAEREDEGRSQPDEDRGGGRSGR